MHSKQASKVKQASMHAQQASTVKQASMHAQQASKGRKDAQQEGIAGRHSRKA
jgi:hypothetical protein